MVHQGELGLQAGLYKRCKSWITVDLPEPKVQKATVIFGAILSQNSFLRRHVRSSGIMGVDVTDFDFSSDGGQLFAILGVCKINVWDTVNRAVNLVGRTASAGHS